MIQDIWTQKMIYCPKCGTLNKGYESSDGRIKYECNNPRCRMVMIRSVKGRKHETVDLYNTKKSEPAMAVIG